MAVVADHRREPRGTADTLNGWDEIDANVDGHAQLLELIRGEVPANAIVDLTIDAERVEVTPSSDGTDQEGSVRAEPEPHGYQGFLPPMRGRLDDEPDPEQPDA